MVAKILPKIKINFHNVDRSQSVVDYFNKKIKDKFSVLGLQSGKVNIKRDHEKGVSRYSLYFDMIVKGRRMFLKEKGDNIFAMIDLINDKMKAKISKLKNRRTFRKVAYA